MKVGSRPTKDGDAHPSPKNPASSPKHTPLRVRWQRTYLGFPQWIRSVELEFVRLDRIWTYLPNHIFVRTHVWYRDGSQWESDDILPDDWR